METIKINLDALSKDHWSKQDLEKAEIAVDFIQKIMNDHDFDYIEAKYGDQPYKQHNRSMLDGIQGVLSSMRELCTGFPEFNYDVKHIYVDGDYVTCHSHATFHSSDRSNPNKGLNIYDTWQIVGDELVEHWDAIQGIDMGMRQLALQNGDLVRNDNTLF